MTEPTSPPSLGGGHPLTLDVLAATEDYPVETETLLRVAQTRLLFTRLDTLVLDHPEILPRPATADHETRAESEADALEDWLLRAGSLLSPANAHGGDAVNTRPRLTGESVVGYRPPRYGRASLVPVEIAPGEERLFDIKGVGLAGDQAPSLDQHGSGLALLPDALREIINAAVLERVFEREGLDGLSCLPCYALIDLGILGRNRHYGAPVPAVTMLRRAELRFAGNFETPDAGSEEEAALHAIELRFRELGITSTNEEAALHFARREGDRLELSLGDHVYEGIPQRHIERLMELLDLRAPCRLAVNNIQTTRSPTSTPLRACLTDLEQFRDYRPMELCVGLVTFVSDRPFNIGQITRTGSSDWVDAGCSGVVDPELYGPGPFSPLACEVLDLPPEARRADAGIEGSVRLAYDLAARMIVGELDRRGLEDRVEALAREIVPERPA